MQGNKKKLITTILKNIPKATEDIISIMSDSQADAIINIYKDQIDSISDQSKKPKLTVEMLNFDTFISNYGNYGKLTVSKPIKRKNSENVDFKEFECKHFDIKQYPNQNAEVDKIFIGDDIRVDVMLK